MRIGLTGSIGSGKSTVLAYFEKLGFKTASCDVFAHHLLQSNATVRAAINERWHINLEQGQEALRQSIANIVFSNQIELLWLESLLHPLIFSMCQHFLDSHVYYDCVVEVPLLFEERWSTLFDCNVCVSVNASVVFKRLLQRGMSAQMVQRRLQYQMDADEREKLADHVFNNSSSLRVLYRQIDEFIEHLGLLRK